MSRIVRLVLKRDLCAITVHGRIDASVCEVNEGGPDSLRAVFLAVTPPRASVRRARPARTRVEGRLRARGSAVRSETELQPAPRRLAQSRRRPWLSGVPCAGRAPDLRP